jgi:hypothetical protein
MSQARNVVPQGCLFHTPGTSADVGVSSWYHYASSDLGAGDANWYSVLGAGGVFNVND